MAIFLTFGVATETLAEGFDVEPFEFIDTVIALRKRLIENDQLETWLDSVAWERHQLRPESDAHFRELLEAILASEPVRADPPVTDSETYGVQE